MSAALRNECARPVIGLVLAAGRGARYAETAAGANKLCAKLPDGRAVIAAALDAIVPHVDHTLVAVQSDQKVLTPYLRRRFVTVVAVDDAALGMGHSLAAAARTAQANWPALAGVVVTLADMPWLPSEPIERVVSELRLRSDEDTKRIVRPRVGNVPGHPVGFSAAYLADLVGLTGDTGASELVRREGAYTRWIETNDYGCVADVDRAADIG